MQSCCQAARVSIQPLNGCPVLRRSGDRDLDGLGMNQLVAAEATRHLRPPEAHSRADHGRIQSAQPVSAAAAYLTDRRRLRTDITRYIPNQLRGAMARLTALDMTKARRALL